MGEGLEQAFWRKAGVASKHMKSGLTTGIQGFQAKAVMRYRFIPARLATCCHPCSLSSGLTVLPQPAPGTDSGGRTVSFGVRPGIEPPFYPLLVE